MIIPKRGDRVRLRDGRIIDVNHVPTNTADPALEGEFDSSMPDETILIGSNIETRATVVTDMSEIILVVDKRRLF